MNRIHRGGIANLHLILAGLWYLKMPVCSSRALPEHHAGFLPETHITLEICLGSIETRDAKTLDFLTIVGNRFPYGDRPLRTGSRRRRVRPDRMTNSFKQLKCLRRDPAVLINLNVKRRYILAPDAVLNPCNHRLG